MGLLPAPGGVLLVLCPCGAAGAGVKASPLTGRKKCCGSFFHAVTGKPSSLCAGRGALSRELSESWSHPLLPWWYWDGCYSQTEGAHLLGDTEAWNKEKTSQCLGFGLEMAARAEYPSRIAARLWLPADSAVTESLPGGVMRTLPGSALPLPFL